MVHRMIEIDNNDNVLSLFEGDINALKTRYPEKKFIIIPDTCDIKRHESLKMFDSLWNRLPIETLIEKGVITVKEDEKLENGKILKLSEIELMEKGLKEIPEGYKLDTTGEIPELKPLTLAERVESNLISKADANKIMDGIRQGQYNAFSDPLFFKYMRGQTTKETWLAEVERIKKEFPEF